jgi:hypothetical protein
VSINEESIEVNKEESIEEVNEEKVNERESIESQ